MAPLRATTEVDDGDGVLRVCMSMPCHDAGRGQVRYAYDHEFGGIEILRKATKEKQHIIVPESGVAYDATIE